MKLRFGLVSAAAVLTTGFVSLAAQAMPTATFKTAAPQVTERASAGPGACGWRHRRSCRAEARRPRQDDFFSYDANTLPFGTVRWRDQMRRENRLGNPG
jgi:hypothetical protein